MMIYEQCNNIDKSENEFERIYNECTSEPYSFIFIDMVPATLTRHRVQICF